MNQLFIETMAKKFDGAFTVEFCENRPFLRFPAKNPDFGDVDIFEDSLGQYVVNVGVFTHGHFDVFDGTDEEKAIYAAEDIADFLELLFADKVLCHGSHEDGGGFRRIGSTNDDMDDLIAAIRGSSWEEWTDQYVWSGLYAASKYRMRVATSTDRLLLEDFFYYALVDSLDEDPPPHDIIIQAGLLAYTDNFSDVPDDCGIIVEADGKAVAAAWTRIIPAHSYIDNETPELAVSVLPEYRSQGIGEVLIRNLFRLLRDRGSKWVCLTIQKRNRAVRFFKRHGFVIVDEKDDFFIMLREL